VPAGIETTIGLGKVTQFAEYVALAGTFTKPADNAAASHTMLYWSGAPLAEYVTFTVCALLQLCTEGLFVCVIFGAMLLNIQVPEYFVAHEPDEYE
jgi:hypothetical protein